MRYVSARGAAPVVDFAGTLLMVLAEDGGLYVPEAWPEWRAEEWRLPRSLLYPALAARVMDGVRRGTACGRRRVGRLPRTCLICLKVPSCHRRRFCECGCLPTRSYRGT